MLIAVFNSISVISPQPVVLSSSFNQWSTEYSFQPTGCFSTLPLSKQVTAVRDEWILSQWPPSILGKNIGLAGDPATSCSQAMYTTDWAMELTRWLSLSQTTNFKLFQTERVCRRQFDVWWKWHKVRKMGRKHCGKRRNCSLWAISPFPTVFSTDFSCRHVKTPGLFGKGLKHFMGFTPTCYSTTVSQQGIDWLLLPRVHVVNMTTICTCLEWTMQCFLLCERKV